MYRLVANWNVKMSAATASDEEATPMANRPRGRRLRQASGARTARMANGISGRMP